MRIPIYMTSWFRQDMTDRAVKEIIERTTPDTYELHVYDNGSDMDTRCSLITLLGQGKLTSLLLDSRNTGCLYNKGIFHMMTESSCPYYVVTDNDVFPPKLSPDWLSQMIAIMEAHPELGMLAPQLPPQWLQQPETVKDDIVYCKAVGNTLKLVRRAAFPINKFKQQLGAYGDDGLVAQQMNEEGWRVAFCRNIFCFHAGQCENWGYTPEQVSMDPRKSGYGTPFVYEMKNWDTYEPMDNCKI
jgi:hypothetical protein